MDTPTFLGILIPVIVAVIGYLFTYFYSRRIEREKNRLIRINKQLDQFYGPLLAIVQANQQAWENFIARHEDNPDFYKKKNHPSPEQVAEFHTWMSRVFMPNNDQLYEIIVNNTSLLNENTIPDVLLKLIAHIMEFRIYFEERVDKHSEVAETKSKYPGKALLEYCEEKFSQLKNEQLKLIKRKK